MATKQEFIVNRKFLFIFVGIQILLVGLVLYALLSPKTVTVQVERLDHSYQIDVPLSIVVPNVNR